MSLPRHNFLRFLLPITAVAACLSLFFYPKPIESSYLPVTGSNIGIGTSTPVGGLTIMNGNVGIGTWSPTQILQVVGTISSTALTTGTSSQFQVNAAGGIAASTSIATSGGYTQSGTDANTLTGTTTFSNVTTSALFTGGNVGIGTTSPTVALLNVNGETYIAGPVGMGTFTPTGMLDVRQDEVRIWTGGGTNTNALTAGELYVEGDLEVDGTIYGDGAGLTGVSGLTVAGGWTDGGTNVYTTTTTDNVGIGTTTPNAATLEIVKNAAQPTLKVSSTATANGDYLVINSQGNIGVGTAAPLAAFVVMNGNVGLGTVMPSSNLEVKGDIALTNGDTRTIRIKDVAGTSGDQFIIKSNSVTSGDGTGGSLSLQAGSGNATGAGGYLTVAAGSSGTTGLGGSLNLLGGQGRDVGNLGGAVNLSGGSGTAGASGGSVNISGGNAIAGNADGGVIMLSGGSGSGTGIAGNIILASSNGSVGIGTSSAAVALLNVNGETYIAGPIGIGTFTPTGMMDIRQDEVRIWTGAGTSTNATAAGELYVEGDLEVDGTIYGDGSGLTGVSGLTMAGGWTDDGTNVYTTTTTDNVGIGTTTPTAALLVENAGTQASFRVNDTALDSSPFIIDDSGNVGIGTTTPGNKLSFGISTGDLIRLYDGASAASRHGIAIRASETQLYIPTSAHVSFNAGGDIQNSGTNELMRISGAGNVGIGTLDPLSKFVVNGGVAIGTLATSNFIAASAPQGGLIVESNVGIGTTSAAVALLNVNGETYIAGPVGIGTFTPTGIMDIRQDEVRIWTGAGTSTNATAAGELYVEGDLEVDGTIYGDGAGLTGVSGLTMAAGWTDGGTNVYTSTTTDNVGIGTTTPSTTLEIVKQGTSAPLMVSATATGDGNFLIINSQGNIGVGTVTPVGKFIIANGDVGIGTISPTNSIEFVGSNDNDAFFRIRNFNPSGFSGFETFDSSSVFSGAVAYGNAGSPYANMMFLSANTGDIGFITGDTYFAPGTTRMIIKNDGNVGIGTTTPVAGTAIMNGNVGIGTWSPRARLEVIGSVLATSFAGDGSLLTNVANSSGWTDGGTNVFTSTTTDNVGIGTTTPSTTFEIVQQGANAPLMVSATPAGDGNYLFVNPVGNLGVGTNSPSKQLEIVDSIASDVLIRLRNLNVSGVAGMEMYDSAGGFQGVLGYYNPSSAYGSKMALVSNTADDIAFITGDTGALPGTERMTIKASSGNVGIGTTEPVAGLAVMNGNVGIGTWSPAGRLVVLGGNVGIGDATPDGRLDLDLISTDTSAASEYGANFTVTDTGVVIAGTDNTMGQYVAVTRSGATGGTVNTYGLMANVTGSVADPGATANTYGILLQVNASDQGTATVYGLYADGNDGDIAYGGYLQGRLRDGGTAYGSYSLARDNDGGTIANAYGAYGEVINDTATITSAYGLYSKITNASTITTGYGLYLDDVQATTDYGIYQVNAGDDNYFAGNIGLGTVTPVGALTVMNGNVGIGTWSPTSRLQVIGTVNATAFVGDGSGLTGINSGGWTDGGTNVYTTATTDNVGIGTTTPISTLTVKGSVGIGTTIPYQTIAAPANGMIVEGNVGIGTFAASSGKLVVMGGNVGVGTTTPDNLLSLKNDQNAPTVLSVENALNMPSSAIDLRLIGAISAPVRIYLGDTVSYTQGSIIYDNFVDSLAFGTNGSTRMTINSNGNIGIGTASATVALLNVNGETYIAGPVGIGTFTPTGMMDIRQDEVRIWTGAGTNTNATDAGELYVEGDLEVDGTIYGDGSGLTGVSGLTVAGGWTDGGTNVYTSTTTDLVAIGTTTPISTLTVKGNVGIGTTAPYTTIAAPLNGMIVEGNVGIGTFSASNSKMVVMGGNVGIGTAVPNAQLELLKTSSSAIAGVEQGLRLIFTDTGAVTTGQEETYGVRTVLTRTGASDATNMYTTGQRIDVTAAFAADGGSGTAQTTGLYAYVLGNTNNANNAVGVLGLAESADTNTGGRFSANGNTATGISADAYPRNGGNGVAGNFYLEELSSASVNNNYGINVYVTDGFDIAAGTDTTYGGNFYISRVGATTGTINTYGLNVLLSTDDAGAGTSTAYGILINTDTAGTDNADTLYGMRIETEANAGTTAYGLYVDAGSAAGTEYAAIFLNGNIGVGTVAPVGALTVMNGNVGIGTWSPTQRLQVVGTVAATAFVGDGSGLTGLPGGGGWTDGGANVYTSTTTDNIGIGTTTPTAALLVENAGTQESFRVNDAVLDGSPFIITSNGNVGIGTTTPTQKLDVNGNISAIGGVIGVGIIDFNAFGGSTTIYGGSSPDYISLRTGGGIERFLVDGSGNIGIGTGFPVNGTAIMNGNVGIGTWSPTSRLQVIGTVNATAFVGDGSGLTGLPAGGGWTDGGTNVYTSTTTDTVGIGTTTASSTLEIVQQSSTSPLMVSATASGDGNYLIITSSGNVGVGTTQPRGKLIVANGNIGIGTTSPQYALEITENAETAIPPEIVLRKAFGQDWYSPNFIGQMSSGTLASPGDVVDGWDIVRFVGEGWSNSGYLSFGWISIGVDGTPGFLSAPGAIRFYTTPDGSSTPALRMTVRSNGSVGIGTAGVTDGLSIMSGNVGIGTWSSPANRLSIVGNIGIGTTLPYRRISAPNNGMVVEGNVGIGTWNPTANLDVFGHMRIRTPPAGNDALYILYPGTGTGVVSYRPDQGFSVSGTTDFSPVLFSLNRNNTSSDFFAVTHTTSGDRLMVKNSGNVGIGTTNPVGGLTVMNGNVGIGTWSPTSRLQVIGTVAATAFVGDGSGLTGLPAGGGWTDGGTNVYTSTTTDLVAIGTTTPISTLTVKGNVGIGTTTPYSTMAAPLNGMIIEGNVGIGTWSAAGGKLIVMGGGVGIGTVAPSSFFEVSDPAAGGSRLSFARNGGGGSILAIQDSGDNPWNIWQGHALNALGFYYNANGNPTLHLDSSGNVGIGDFSQDARLYVANGNVGIGTATPVNGTAIMNGNVGIGTWSPGTRLQVNNTASYVSEYDNGTQAVGFNVDWNNGNKQRVTLGAAGLNVTFTAPSGGVANLMIKIIQDGSGSRTIASWPGTVRWPGGTAPTLTTTAGAVDIVTCYYDRTNYYCTNSLDFQ